MVPWRIERLQGFAVQQEQKSGLQVGELIAAAVGFQGGALWGTSKIPLVNGILGVLSILKRGGVAVR